jgi:flagellar hook-length control protein FliK
MPVDQIRTAFANTVNGSENEVTELAQKVMQLVKDNASGKPYSITFNNVSPAQDKNSDPGQFDTKTLRAILKIDGSSETAIENSDAANNNEKLNIPGSVNQLLAKNPAESAVTGMEQLPVADVGKVGVAQNMPMFEAKTIPGQTKSFQESESVMNQISEKLNTAVRSGINEVKIQLRPESLGEVNLKIRIEGDVVMARIQVESHQVKQIVESNMQHLKDALAQQNLQAGSLEVNVGSGNGEQADQTQYHFAAGHENHISGESQKADSDGREEATE